ncbi:Predicted oxidoreductase [Luteibacter sp. UNCMF331Sha3.1]|uniref:aldo/keto reductase n=1 Tax=Luteibacter sp. UNCMF331Sha3.1 TaxID=1502760 RepID=UPI0008C93D7C|nr:aldo/keto reductase [Luteibacter sp. UNCMF331Sha3.1]SEM38833.1 Predicted oxidoreductase [Luteibacter sp. UNCMF331Sha3.1]
MRYVKLGRTGLEISPLVLGCMTYGVADRGAHAWTLDEEQSRPFIRKALDLGVNVFDTANMYSDGTSEEILGRALRDFARRDEVVIATKTFMRWGKGPNMGGLSRKAIFQSVDDSLRRLGTDYVDLLQIHRHDGDVPVEETLEALHDVVKAGKARYLGASSMYAWQFAQMIYTSRLHGWTEFVSMQNHYNLIQREDEREMIPFCRDQGIALLPWSPLARGRLTRDWDDESERQKTDVFGGTLYTRTEDADRRIVAAVKQIAAARGIPRAQVALAWVARRPGVTAPIVGASKPHHLNDAVAAIDLALTDDEMAVLEEAYTPRPLAGFD